MSEEKEWCESDESVARLEEGNSAANKTPFPSCAVEPGQGSPEAYEVNDPVPYRKITFQCMTEKINASYEPDISHRYSRALDTLASFVRGHKHMYNESKSYASARLHCLMIPALVLSGIMSVIQSPPRLP